MAPSRLPTRAPNCRADSIGTPSRVRRLPAAAAGSWPQAGARAPLRYRGCDWRTRPSLHRARRPLHAAAGSLDRDVSVVAKMLRERAFEAAELVGSIGRRGQASRQLLQPCKVRASVHDPSPSSAATLEWPRHARTATSSLQEARTFAGEGGSHVCREDYSVHRAEGCGSSGPAHYGTATRPRSWQQHSYQPPVKLVSRPHAGAHSQQATDHPRHRSEGACMKPTRQSKRARRARRRGIGDQRRRLHWARVRPRFATRHCAAAAAVPSRPPCGLSARRRAMAREWSNSPSPSQSHGQQIRGCALTTQATHGDPPLLTVSSEGPV